jgi:pimeloyl-ACP methyl ester carboxylesterase
VKGLDVNGIRIAYRRAGQGDPLILLHGFISDSRVWRPQIEEFSSDFDVIAWDAPGCGESSDPPEEFTMGDFVDCLAGLLNALGVSPAHLMGLSWGGTAALEFHRRYREKVRSLVLADAYAGWTGSLGAEAARQRLERCLRESQMPAAEWVPKWVPEAFSSNASQTLLDEYAAIMSDFHPVGFRAMSRAVTPDFREALRIVSVPTLLIWGAEDSRSPVSCGEHMRELIPGSRLVIIEEAGHVSNFEQRDRFNAVVREFIMGLGKE